MDSYLDGGTMMRTLIDLLHWQKNHSQQRKIFERLQLIYIMRRKALTEQAGSATYVWYNCQRQLINECQAWPLAYFRLSNSLDYLCDCSNTCKSIVLLFDFLKTCRYNDSIEEYRASLHYFPHSTLLICDTPFSSSKINVSVAEQRIVQHDFVIQLIFPSAERKKKK